MPDLKVQTLAERDAIDQIVRTVKLAPTGDAPFALVLGSGFSHGLVPIASELVTDSLPLWMKSLEEDRPYEELKKLPSDERIGIAGNFWRSFVDHNSGRPGFSLSLNSQTNIPDDYSEAYQAAFNPEYDGAVNPPKLAREFQRSLMQLNKPRLNAAHFLLASLLGVQPGKATRRNNLFKARAAFSRLILTTNFDPFLQTALQAVNQLYFMSDTPRLGVSDEIYEDQAEAIHLVYLHGSVHRRDQAATKADIDKIKQRNATILAPVLERHGVIVLGYSGWDDALVEALAACGRFDNRLYWCGREPNPLAPGAFGKRVPEILQKPAAMYVQIASAGSFMAQLCGRLVEGLPRLIDNPIGQLRELLDTIDLEELEALRPTASGDPNAPQLLQSGSAPTAMVQAKLSTIERLRMAEEIFLGKVASLPLAEQILPAAPAEAGAEQPEVVAASTTESKSKIEQLQSSAQLALGLGNYAECLRLADEALNLTNLEVEQKAKLLGLRALANYFSGALDKGIVDWTQVIDLPGAPIEQVAEALFNRGVTREQQGDIEGGVADYTRVIELPELPVEGLAKALINRGVTWARRNEPQKALADYETVIEKLPEVPVEPLTRALNNRGRMWELLHEPEKAIADYSRVIDGFPDAPLEQLSQALVNRGVYLANQGQTEKGTADFERVIEQLPDAPVMQIALALNNRGASWIERGDSSKAIADFTRVIEELPGTPVGEIASALNSRSLAWSNLGEQEKSRADRNRVIELPGAPDEEVAIALGGRGWGKYKANEFDGFLADTEAALQKDPSLSFAAFNLGLALLALGRDEEAMTAYRRAGEQFPEAIDEDGMSDLNEARKTWLSEERARAVIDLLAQFKKKPK